MIRVLDFFPSVLPELDQMQRKQFKAFNENYTMKINSSIVLTLLYCFFISSAEASGDSIRTLIKKQWGSWETCFSSRQVTQFARKEKCTLYIYIY